MKKTSGFTFIELLVSATIIIIISAIGVVSFTSTGRSARDGKRKADLETIRQALVLLRSDAGAYPSGGYSDMITSLVSGGYLSQPTPAEPRVATQGEYAYSTNGSGTNFCLCANTEDDAKNANAGSTGAGGVCSFGAANKTHYCVSNP